MNNINENKITLLNDLDIIQIRISVILDSIVKAKLNTKSIIWGLIVLIFSVLVFFIKNDTSIFLPAAFIIALFRPEENILVKELVSFIFRGLLLIVACWLSLMQDIFAMFCLATIIGFIDFCYYYFVLHNTMSIIDNIDKITKEVPENQSKLINDLYDQLLTDKKFKPITKEAHLNSNWLRQLFGKESVKEPEDILHKEIYLFDHTKDKKK